MHLSSIWAKIGSTSISYKLLSKVQVSYLQSKPLMDIEIENWSADRLTLVRSINNNIVYTMYVNIRSRYSNKTVTLIQQSGKCQPHIQFQMMKFLGVYIYIYTHTTLAWTFKDAARCLTRILPGKYHGKAVCQ